MSTTDPVIAFIGPQGDQLCTYNRRLPASQQPASISRVFCDAMTVRETVFVKEQKAIPLVHHIDPDDARSYHWVIYAPASEVSAPGEPSLQPVGTIRLCPHPHGPHPQPGATYTAPGEDDPVEDSETFFRGPPPEYRVDRATNLCDGKEPYIQLGRHCVVKEFRGRKLSGILVQAALKWARENPHFSKYGMPEWKGLVCVHAQERAVTTWRRNGFVLDEGMGSWVSTGMNHYGLFQRLDIRN